MKIFVKWWAKAPMAAALLVAASCSGLEYSNMGDAILEITPEGDTETVLSHELGRSEVRLAPPIDSRLSATFVYLDPQTMVTIILDETKVEEEQTIEFPIEQEIAELVVEFNDKVFTADGTNAQGSLTVERLDTDQANSSFRGAFIGTVMTEDGEKAAINGYIDAQSSVE